MIDTATVCRLAVEAAHDKDWAKLGRARILSTVVPMDDPMAATMREVLSQAHNALASSGEMV